MLEIADVIRRFNTLNGKRHDVNSTSIRATVETAIREFGEDLITEVIEKERANSIYNVMDIFFLKNYVRTKNVQAVETGTPVTAPVAKANEIEQSLGMLERALASVMVDKYAPKLSVIAVEEIKKYIAENYGTIQRKIEYKIDGKVVMSDVVHERFQDVLDLVVNNEPVFLTGRSGTGKNVIAKQVSKALQLEFYFSNAVQQPFQITGFVDANGRYHETEFYRAWTKGGIFMLDEADASVPEIFIMLNAAIANRYFEFPNIGKVNAHENFRVIAAGNTYGTGATREYSGRNQLDGASLNRFAFIEIDYSPAIENSLTGRIDMLEFVRDFRQACEKASLPHPVSYREIIRMDKMLNIGWSIKKTLRSCLLKGLQQDDVNMIINELKSKDNEFVKGLK